MTKIYRQTLANWRKEKEEVIRQENGWLALAGLYWLKIGKNRAGSDPTCEIQLPSSVPALIGSLDHNGKSVTLHAENGHKANVNGKVTDFAILQPDISDNPSFITFNDIRLVVIQRGNRIGVRIWDNSREERHSFPARTWFDVNEKFRLPACYTAYPHPEATFFPDITGEKTESTVDGFLEFEYKHNSYQLDVTKEEENELFVRFKDPTSDTLTYPAGRYMVVNLEKDNAAFVDFNYSYNPPCAFTDFATCVFAPEQNYLDFKVTAGETYQRHK
jgi:uncharacterized protein (DUF1684 family)